MTNIDWALLREQKLHLLEVLPTLSPEKEKSLTGILHLIDSIQDDAVESRMVSEEEVFGVIATSESESLDGPPTTP